MNEALKIVTLTLGTISMACDDTGAKERVELYKTVDELCECCAVGIGGRCEFDADRLATAAQQLTDAAWEDLRYESDGLEKMSLVRREVEAAEALAYECVRQRFLLAGSPGRLWRALHAAISLPEGELRGPAIFSLLSERARRRAAVEAAKLHEARRRHEQAPSR